MQARPIDGTPLSLGGDGEIDLKLSEFAYELAARIGRSPAAPALSLTEGETTEPAIRDEWTPLGRWDGYYNHTRRISLAIETLEGDKLRGRMEYPTEGTSTIIEGSVHRRWSTDDPSWAQVGGGAGSVQAVSWFRETGYEKRGSAAISFDGEYRMAFQIHSATGAWFSGDRLVGSLTLERKRVGNWP